MNKENDNIIYFPLSASQMNIWRLEQAYPGTPINNICETVRINGIFDVVLLQRCLNSIIESDCALRTQIKLYKDMLPVQYEARYEKQHFPVLDFSATNSEGLKRWEESITREVMTLIDMPLFYFAIIKINEHEGGVFVKTHHLISDGWSQISLINRIAETYLALVSGENAECEILPSYLLHVDEENTYRTSRAYWRDLDYWREKVKDMPGCVSLKECRANEISPVGHRKSYECSEIMNHELINYCTKHRIAPMLVLYTAVGIFIARTQDIKKFCMGTPVHNRSNITARKTTGMFVSTLPFLSVLDENMTFEQYTDYLAEEWMELLRHQRLRFDEITEECRKANSDIDRLFNMVINFHSSHAYQNRDTLVSFSGQWHYAGYQAEHLCIHLNNILDEKRFSVSYDFLTQLFSEDEIDNIHHYLMSILKQVLASPDKPIKKLMFLSEAEKEKVLFGFNSTDKFRLACNLNEALNAVYNEHSKRAAVIENGVRYTYSCLEKKAELIAEQIDKTVADKAVVAIMLPRSFALFSAMAGIVRSGRAWLILSESMPKARRKEILSDSEAAAIITDSSFNYAVGDEQTIIDINCIMNMDRMAAGETENKSLPSDTAYVVYTSGSTGKPKGVEIEQHSIINFSQAMKDCYGTGAVLSLCNITFDAFLIESISAMLNGRTVVLPKDEDMENPSRLASLIENYAVGFISATPSRIQTYMRSSEFTRAIGRLDCILCGGEAFPISLYNIIAKHTKARVINQYGPSETTVGVSMCCINDSPAISVGRPMHNCRLYILDKNLMPLPIGVYGELYIGGDCVAKGYLNAPELTKKAFIPSPFEGGERLYRSGDIAAWTENGEVILRGRNDNQIKLRGQRIEIDEIALTLMNHPLIRKAAVVLKKDDDSEYLAAYYESEQALTDCDLMEHAASYLPGYMVPSVFVYMKKIPLTPNGKVNYKKLPEPDTMLQAQSEGGQDEAADRILDIFKEVLHKPDMNVSSDYFRFGGDSLNALDALARIETEFGIRLRVSDIYAYRSAARISMRLSQNSALITIKEQNAIKKAPQLEYYPVTKTQFGIYFETLMSPNICTYNMPCGFKTAGKIDFDRLQKAANALLERETVLKLSFFNQNGEICQKINNDAKINVERYENMPFSKAATDFVRPFDLLKAPLMRIGAFESDNECTVLVDMHHIIGDAMTAAMLIERLGRLYLGETIEEEKLSYTDYAFWRVKNSEAIEKDQLEYWQNQLTNVPELPDYPTDRMRTAQFDYKGEQCILAVGEKESVRLNDFAKSHDLTANMIFAGAFGVFLSKLSGSSELFVGVPVSNRCDESLYDVAGLFVNTLPLRLSPEENLTFKEYLEKTKESIIGLLDNPDVPLEKLAEFARQSGHEGQLYNAIMSMRPVVTDNAEFGGYKAERADVPSASAKTELNLEVFFENGSYALRLEYASSLFDKQTAEMFERSLKAIITDILSDENKKIGDCQAISPADRYRLIDMPNALRIPFVDMPIDRHIDMACELSPDDTAIIFHGETTTFRELKEQSDRLASRIMKEGIKRGDNVGILCRRGPELLIAMIGVLKTGAAYVPMLPSYPENRIKYMMEISGIKLTLCDDETLKEKPEGLLGNFISIKEAILEGELPFEQVYDRDGEDTCFVLFTSGSTGQPKGVMIRHGSISCLFENLKNNYNVTGSFLSLTNFVFDIFVAETLIVLAVGKTVVLADEEEMLLPWKTSALFNTNNVGMIQFTPTRAQVFMQHKDFFDAMRNIPVVMTAGEALPQQLLDKFREAECRRILNLYGPTEATVYVSYDDVTNVDKITIGKIYPNSRGYVLDEKHRIVMPGARGEFYFAGQSLTKGYIGREDLTAESYLPDPFFKGTRMYKSGDLVRQLADGRYDYCGRSDHQIKLNGQRIELGEINRRMLDSKLVSQAATVVVKDNGIMLLYGFVVPFEGEDKHVDIQKLRDYLKGELPVYMVPSVIYKLTEFPKTPSGKTDLKALEKTAEAIRKNREIPEVNNENISTSPEEKTVQTEIKTEKAEEKIVVKIEEKIEAKAEDNKEEPKAIIEEIKEEPKTAFNENIFAAEKAPSIGLTEGDLKDIWREVLSRNDIPEDVSFFEIGGTSFGALTVLSEYFRRDIHISLADLYANPTIKSQKRLLGISDEIKTVENTSEAIIEIKETDVVNTEVIKDRKAVFVTGATGFFGAHVVKELIEDGTPKIYCLIRGNEARLYEVLAWYFGNGWMSACKNKIIPVKGELLEKDLGIGSEYITVLNSEVGTIIHSAADVRHYSADDMPFRINVEGTRSAIALAEKIEAEFVYISTVSIGAEYIIAEPERRYEFSEKDFDLGQNYKDNIYLRGKFEAEKIVREANENGLKTIILRLGRLVGRSSDGVFQINPENNAFWGLVRAMASLDEIPTELNSMQMEMTAVDECARAAVLLLNEKSGEVFHLFNPNTMAVREILKDLNISSRETDRLSFERHIRQKTSEGCATELALLLSEYQRYMLVPQNAMPVCKDTEERLGKLGFEWKAPRVSSLLKMFIM